MHHRYPCSAAALLLATCASAQDMQQVTVSASKTDARERETTTAIVIGHEDIMRQDDGSLADVLKRQPGITVDGAPGRPGAIRMRGLGNGYAAILLNGVPAPAGFSLESITPDLVERIEILRAPTAEVSNQSIAGAINVVLRKAAPRAQSDLKAGIALANGRPAPTLTAQRSDRAGALAYTLAATLKRSDVEEPSVALEQGREPDLLRYTWRVNRMTEDTLELAPRLSWQDEGNTVVSNSYLRYRRVHNQEQNRESTLEGDWTRYPNSHAHYDARPVNLYSDLGWTRKLAAGSRLELKLSGYYTTRRADFAFVGNDGANRFAGLNQVASGPTESDIGTTGSYRRPLGANHALAFGWEAGRKQRSEYRREHQWNADGLLTLYSDEDFSAQVARTAFFAQDEWDLGPGASLYLGLRREDLHTVGDGTAHLPVDRRSGVWSPLAQLLWKLPGGAPGAARDQLRLALGRTYKAPEITRLMPRRYTVNNNNSPTNPDQQGNPNLRPELAWGLDAAWERYFGKDNMLGLSSYYKRIRDVTVDRLQQANGIWTNEPDNGGNATVRGIELEAKVGWRQLALRANAARNWSRVDAVPGPDNRLDSQAPFTANLGLDAKLAGGKLGVGGTFSYRGSTPARTSPIMRSWSGAKRELDLYAAWELGGKARLRAAVTNLLHQAWAGQDVYADGERYLSRTVFTDTFPTFRLAWETTL
ncbi:MAG: TonB-dependent receptor plug domain-containing protein [Massilia sp.]